MSDDALQQQMRLGKEAIEECARLRAENKRLTRERDEVRQHNKDWFAAQKIIDLDLRTEIDRLNRLNDAAERKVERLREATPEMLIAAQMKSELGAYVCANMVGAYGMIEELWRVMADIALKETGPENGEKADG